LDEGGYRRILGVAEGHKEDKAGWLQILKHLKRRGLSGVRLIVSDACLGLAEAALHESLIRAFQWFGGVPRQVWVDNQKAAVLKHVPGAVRFNERFKQLACHYGFVPKACRPYRARTKSWVS